jgi:hypothetical protein
VIGLVCRWFEERRQYFDGGPESVPEVDDLTTWASWKVNSRTFPVVSAALSELTKIDTANGSRLPDRLVTKLNEFGRTLRLVFRNSGIKPRDFCRLPAAAPKNFWKSQITGESKVQLMHGK